MQCKNTQCTNTQGQIANAIIPNDIIPRWFPRSFNFYILTYRPRVDPLPFYGRGFLSIDFLVQYADYKLAVCITGLLGTSGIMSLGILSWALCEALVVFDYRNTTEWK